MPLDSTRAQAPHIAMGSWSGKPTIARAMALLEANAASAFSLPIRINWTGVGLRRVRRAITWLDAAIISVHRRPRDIQERAAVVARGEIMGDFRFMARFEGEGWVWLQRKGPLARPFLNYAGQLLRVGKRPRYPRAPGGRATRSSRS